jgi:hypothetical protein
MLAMSLPVVNLTLGEAFNILVTLAGVVTIIAVQRNDMSWIKEMLKKHEEEDVRRFADLKRDIYHSQHTFDEG